MKYYSTRVLGLEAKHFVEVPCDSLSLAVLIGSEPYGLSVRGSLFEFGDKLFFVVGDLVDRLEPVVDIDAETFFLKVTDMAVARHDLIVFAEEFFDCFCFCGRFDYYEIFQHSISVF